MMVHTKFSNLRNSILYLVLAFIALCYSNGQLLIPIAVFIAPVFLIRFMKGSKPWIGFVALLPIGWISNIFIWKYMMPIDGIFFYIITFQLSLLVALVYLANRVFSQRFNGFISTLVFPSAFVLMEFILVYAVPAGTMGKLAHTQQNTILLQLLSLTGIWGITFIITWTASVINWLWDNKFEIAYIKRAAIYFGLPLLLILIFGQIRLLSHSANTETVKIASIILDRNDSKALQSLKETEDFELLSAQMGDRFITNCEIAMQSGAKIIFGQEQLLQFWHENVPQYIDTIKQIAIKHDVYIGLPLSVVTQAVREKHYPAENKIIWISPQGKILNTYFKAKPLYGRIIYGDGQLKYFDTPYGRISSAICFDMDFLQVVRQISNKDIDIMLVPANDWKEVSPYHTFLTSSRAIEQGFNLVRPTGHGLSASFDYKGQIISKLDYFNNSETIMYSNVPTKGTRTLYAVLGDYFAYMCILFFFTTVTLVICRKWKR